MAPSDTTASKKRKQIVDTSAASSRATTPAPATKRLRRPNAKWTQGDSESMISQLQDAKDQGLTSDNGFKQSVWNSIAESLNDPLKTARSCETKWGRLKKSYLEVKYFYEASGFGWD
jgi:hypothetical protein